ncbi:MAG TPA: UDP-N-acetylmuramate--L-alanine ligase [Acidimicrobiales bacterium]
MVDPEPGQATDQATDRGVPPAGGRVALDLTQPARVHVVGIGGAGMSAIATVLAGMGHQVSGSDLKDSTGLERLRALGVDVHVGHDAANLPAALDAVTISTAVPARNAEVVAAGERGIVVLRRAETLAAIAATRRSIAVAGTHGKTTTSSMLALVLIEAGLRPSFIIGGEVNEIGTGAVWDEGELLVIEADESDGTFLELPRFGSVVTSIEPDHLEFYGGFEPLKAAFGRFLAETPGPRVVCADDELASTLGRAAGAVTYGTAPGADYRMTDLQSGRGGSSFGVTHAGQDLGRVQLPIAGDYNARNAAAALVMGMELGASFEAGRKALARFAGVARRLEYRGEVDGITFIDDYAHLPSEVASVLSSTRTGGWGRVVCVFQPHRYSRTEALWRDFADSFGDADVVVLTDIYPSGETPRPGISGTLVAQAVLDAHPWRRLAYLPRRADIVAFLSAELRPGDLCLTLGAGDLTSMPEEIQTAVRARYSGSAA